MSRRIEKLPDHVYFVIGGPFTSYNGVEYTTVDGPYATLSAAKGKRTALALGNMWRLTDAEKEARYKLYSIIQSPTGEWEKVEL